MFDERLVKEESLKEIVALKQCMHYFETKQLDFDSLKCRTIENSIYGQITGWRLSKRAFELSKICGQNFSSSLTWFVPSIRDFKEKEYYKTDPREYTALEFYLEKLEYRNDRTKIKNIIQYLKGEVTYEQFIQIYEQ